MNIRKKIALKKRAFAFILMISLLLTGVMSVSADELSDKIDQKDEIDSELGNIGGQITDKENEKDDIKNELDWIIKEEELKELEKQRTIEELESLKNDILSIDENIATLQAEFDEKEKLFLARAKMMYQYSDYSVLDIFFQSKDLFDFFERVNLYKKMLDEDKTLMDEVLSLQNTLESKKTLRETTFADKEVLLAEAEKAIDAIKNDRELIQSEYEALIKALDELAAEEERLEAESDSLQSDIDYLEEQKRQEEEEKKNNSNNNSSSDSNSSGSSSGSGPVSNSGFMFPLESYVYLSSSYGYRTHPVTGKPYTFHTGIDLAAYGGTPIYAVADGVVTVAEPVDRGGYGKWVEIEHANGTRTRYAHADAIYVSSGATVKQGQKIAIVGTTGTSTGNHLHFEVRINGDHKNPENYLTIP